MSTVIISITTSTAQTNTHVSSTLELIRTVSSSALCTPSVCSGSTSNELTIVEVSRNVVCGAELLKVLMIIVSTVYTCKSLTQKMIASKIR